MVAFARADAFFVTYVTLGDLWSHGAFERALSLLQVGQHGLRGIQLLADGEVSEEATLSGDQVEDEVQASRREDGGDEVNAGKLGQPTGKHGAGPLNKSLKSGR